MHIHSLLLKSSILPKFAYLFYQMDNLKNIDVLTYICLKEMNL